MAYLVSLAQAKQHLRITSDVEEEDIDFKVQQASAIMADYLKSATAAAWTEETVPGPVQAATLLLITSLYERRGDDMAADAALWQAIERLVIRYRDPALA